ncbi:MAG: methyltransferase domain-containing protein [Solirubrobacterales bacterium]|nr:methyltransferase domain-containing protein [Solirubrobacterales bacterium]
MITRTAFAAVPHETTFEAGLQAWRRNLGTVRDEVRQELVSRQLHAHLPGRSLRALDIGCGQGTQALRLARLGHSVLGIDTSDELLEDARRAAAAEPPDVRERVSFERADVLTLPRRHAGSFDLACCHGVVMYLPALADAIAAVVATARRGGLISVLTRNRASLAMRAGMSADWQAALEAFDARSYTNRLGIDDVRADDPAEVRAALADAGAPTIAWYGVRLFCDHWPDEPAPADADVLVDAEEQAGRRDPYRAVAALTHTIARAGEGAAR